MDDEAAAAQEGAEADVVDAPAETEAEVADVTEEQDAPEASADGEEVQDAEETDEDASEEGEEEAAEVEEIEFDFGGNKLKVPKDSVPEELRDQIDRFTKGTWSDYTRKSQEVAERTKALEARESAVEGLSAMNFELLDSFSRGQSIKNELAQLGSVDLNALWQSDPDQARRVSDQISAKQAQLNSVVSEVVQKELALSNAQAKELQRRQSEGEQAIERQIKNFKAEKLPDVIDYAVNSLGIDRAVAERDWALTPGGTIAVYKAMQFDALQAKAAKAAKPKPAQAKPVKSVKSVSATAPKKDLVKDAHKMTTEEWLAQREAEIQRAR